MFAQKITSLLKDAINFYSKQDDHEVSKSIQIDYNESDQVINASEFTSNNETELI
jgi:hypothetical protein